MSDGKKWYYAEKKERKGPFSEEHLIEFIRAGAITESTLLWTSGFENWRKAKDTEMAAHFSAKEESSVIPLSLKIGQNFVEGTISANAPSHTMPQRGSSAELVTSENIKQNMSDVDILQKNTIVTQIKNSKENNALLKAIGNGNLEAVETLLSSGSDVNARNPYGNTALMYATRKDKLDIVKTLLNAGADVNAKNPEGKTALMYAADKGNPEVIKLFLAAGANVNAKTPEGKTALMYAAEKRKSEIINLLKKRTIFTPVVKLFKDFIPMPKKIPPLKGIHVIAITICGLFLLPFILPLHYSNVLYIILSEALLFWLIVFPIVGTIVLWKMIPSLKESFAVENFCVYVVTPSAWVILFLLLRLLEEPATMYPVDPDHTYSTGRYLTRSSFYAARTKEGMQRFLDLGEMISNYDRINKDWLNDPIDQEGLSLRQQLRQASWISEERNMEKQGKVFEVTETLDVERIEGESSQALLN